MNRMTSRPAIVDTRTMDERGAEQPAGRILNLPPAPEAIELRHLRSFVAVAEELNFGRAAARLYVSQPALSRQIQALERLLGCRLLRRSTHRVELTLAGEALLGGTRPLLTDLDNAVVTTRSVGGELLSRIAQLWAPLVVEGGSTKANLHTMRDGYEALHANFPPPAGVTVRPANAGGVPALLAAPDRDQPATVMLLHGGGYVMGSAFGYQGLAGALAAATQSGTLVPDFRLAPEHPYPAALEDAQRAYQWMLDQGVQPHEICLAGDSAGGGLVMSLLIWLKREGLPMPGRAVLLSASVDLTGELLAAQLSIPADDEGLDPTPREQIMRWTNGYLGDHRPQDEPILSPLTADLTGLPPLLIQAGTGDPMAEESRQLAAHATEHGVDARLELYPVCTHVFHLFWSFLPEAADALEQVGRFVRETSAPGRRAATDAG
jgi:acetyl esterase/lipase